MSETAGEPSQANADLELARRRVDALFTRDACGNLVTLNELEPAPPPTPAPRIYLGVTAGGIVRDYRADVPPELRRAVEVFCEGASPLAYSHPAFFTGLQAAMLVHDLGAAAWEISTGPAYVFPADIPIASGVSIVEPGQADLLKEHFPFTATWLHERRPCYAVVVGDQAVSICYSARRTGTVAEAGVDTAEVFRGRGYAALVASAWAHAIRAAGITPVYSTSDDNLASQAVARKLGLREFCGDTSIT